MIPNEWEACIEYTRQRMMDVASQNLSHDDALANLIIYQVIAGRLSKIIHDMGGDASISELADTASAAIRTICGDDHSMN